MNPRLPVFLDARPLKPILVPGEDPRFLTLTIDSFFDACVLSRQLYCPSEWAEFLSEHIQNTYLELSTTQGLFTVVNGNTGTINKVCWYSRYVDTMLALNAAYRSEITGVFNHAQNLGFTVKQLRYVQHNDHYLLASASCQYLLTHDPS